MLGSAPLNQSGLLAEWSLNAGFTVLQVVFIFQRWCQAFFDIGFSISVTTNNGVDTMNNSIKNSCLILSVTGTLTTMVETVVCDFIPELILEYINTNYCSSSQYRQYNASIPYYLHNRRREFIRKCLARYHAGEYADMSDITEMSSVQFAVSSESNPGISYKMDFGTDDHHPS